MFPQPGWKSPVYSLSLHIYSEISSGDQQTEPQDLAPAVGIRMPERPVGAEAGHKPHHTPGRSGEPGRSDEIIVAAPGSPKNLREQATLGDPQKDLR